MSKLSTKLQEEFKALLPPTIFFFVALHLVAFMRALMLKGTGIATSTSWQVTLAALILGKAVLVADLLPFINRYPDKPLIYNIAWKTTIYVLVAMLVHYLERLVDFWKEAGGLVAGNQKLLAEIVQAQRSAQLQCLRLLAPGHGQRLPETGFRLSHIGARALEQQGPLEPIHLGLPPPLLGRGHPRHGLSQDCQPGLGLPRLARRLRQQGEKIGAVQLETCPLDHFQPCVDVCHTSGRVPRMASAHPSRRRPNTALCAKPCAMAKAVTVSARAYVVAASRRYCESTAPISVP